MNIRKINILVASLLCLVLVVIYRCAFVTSNSKYKMDEALKGKNLIAIRDKGRELIAFVETNKFYDSQMSYDFNRNMAVVPEVLKDLRCESIYVYRHVLFIKLDCGARVVLAVYREKDKQRGTEMLVDGLWFIGRMEVFPRVEDVKQ